MFVQQGVAVELAFWRNLAIIWLSLFCIIGLAIPLVISYFVVRGVGQVHGKLQPLLHKAQGYSGTLRQQSEKASIGVSEPLLRLQHRATRVQTTLNRILPARKPRAIRKIR